MTFTEIVHSFSWTDVQEKILAKRKEDVEKALQRKDRSLEDFMALISPAATPYLEIMARESQQLSRMRFGNNIHMYIPLYLSNECSNTCVYCGFSRQNKIARKTLSPQEQIEEFEAIKKLGFDHILLVTGEEMRKVGFAYIRDAVILAHRYFAQVSLEVQPLEMAEYKELVGLGLHGVYLYQETYHFQNYKQYHLSGKKSDFSNRIEAPARLGEAGVYKIGLGSLLGLEDWRAESFFVAMHLQYLSKRYWKTKFSISFPRLRPFQGSFEPKHPIGDRELVQLICAYRLFDQDIDLALSTREGEFFRNHVASLGITAMSAGSRTNPGAYALEADSLEQFSVSDHRSPEKVAAQLQSIGLEAVWKDWDAAMLGR